MYIHASTKSEIHIFTYTTWMNLKNITLNGRRLIQNTTYYMILLIQKSRIYKSIETEYINP